MELVVEAQGDNRPPVYWEEEESYDGEVINWLIIRASAIGTSCLWELVAAGQGYEPAPLPDVLVRAFREGHELEPVVLDRMRKDGWALTGMQREGELVLPDNIKIRYHPDAYGVVQTESVIRVVEVKCLSHDLWLRFVKHGMAAVLDEYPWQLSIMMHATGQKAVWVGYNKGTPPINEMGDRELCADEGKIVYETVDNPPIPYAEIVDKALRIKRLVGGEDILVSGRQCDDSTHWPCRYRLIRPEPEEAPSSQRVRLPTLTVSDVQDAEVDRLTREYLHAKGIVDEAKAQFDRAKERLLTIGEGYSAVESAQWRIPLVTGTSKSTDWAAMTEDEKRTVKEILGRYEKRTEYRYIRNVTRKD